MYIPHDLTFDFIQAWTFEDYNDEELYQILMSKAKKRGLNMDMRTARAGVKVLAKERMKPNFGLFNTSLSSVWCALSIFELTVRCIDVMSSRRIESR